MGPHATRRAGGWVLGVAAALVGVALGAESLPRRIPVAAEPPAEAAAPDVLPESLGLQRVRAGAVAPPFALRTPQGRPVSGEGLRGKVVLLSFFATWCPTCKAEFPALRDLAARLRGSHFVVLFVNYGEPPDAVRPFMGELNFAHGVLLDPETRVGDAFGVKFLPTHFVIDRRGELVASGVGPKAWDGPESVRLIRRLLETSGGGPRGSGRPQEGGGHEL